MKKDSIRYAVVGLGHIAQVAVLPAFKAAKNSILHSLVSGDAKKLKELSKKYKVENSFSYDEYKECLKDSSLDAVYIALPNHLHKKFAILAAEAGKHVLCEKPLAVTVKDAEEIVAACRRNKVKLMTAYRLHLDPTNLKAIELVHSGKIGTPRFFTSEFGHQVKGDNIRAEAIEGGSPLHDLGIYCINASRYIMRAEPTEVFAVAASPAARLAQIKQTVTAIMKFPGDRLATFLCSFASAGISNFRVIGDKGDLFIENPYEYKGKASVCLTIDEKAKEWDVKIGDQFAAELQYFSDCIIHDRLPEPSGIEGLIDMKIIEALNDSLKIGKPVKLSTPKIKRRPTLSQMIKKAPHSKPKLIHAEPEH
jgi:predicted dehydrogenase